VQLTHSLYQLVSNVALIFNTFFPEESTRRGGDYSDLDLSIRNKGFVGITSRYDTSVQFHDNKNRFPVGLVSMVVPFNFPLNLAVYLQSSSFDSTYRTNFQKAHKIGPAIATGCPFIVKPADRTPVVASILGEILATTNLPTVKNSNISTSKLTYCKGSWSILPCDLKDARHFSENSNIKLLSFTGSAAVGWKLKSAAGKKKVTLELGGNAGQSLQAKKNFFSKEEKIFFYFS
jgi:hypothetical protein